MSFRRSNANKCRKTLRYEKKMNKKLFDKKEERKKLAVESIFLYSEKTLQRT